MRAERKPRDQPLQRRRKRLVFQHKFQMIFLFRVCHRSAGQKHAAQKRHAAAFAHRDFAGHAAPLAHLDAASFQHEGSLASADLDAVGAPPAEPRALERHQLGLHVKNLAQQPERAPGDGVVFRFDGEPLLASAAVDDRTGGADDTAQFRQQTAHAVRLKAAKLLFGLR